MIAAIEFAMILILFFVAGFIVSRFFLKHSRKNDSFVKDLNTIFYKRRLNSRLNVLETVK